MLHPLTLRHTPSQIPSFLIDLEMKAVNVGDGMGRSMGGCNIRLDKSAKGSSPLFCFGLLEQFDQPIIVFSHHSGVTDNNVGRVNSVQIGGGLYPSTSLRGRSNQAVR